MEPNSPPAALRVAVIGGGITGLSAAHRLREISPSVQVTLFEQHDRLGGVVHTEKVDGYLIEHGADMFTTRDPWAFGLCRRIGFDGELINTNSQHARAFVVHQGQLHAVPEGFTLMTPGRMWPIARTPLLSIPGKLRMAAEYFIPRRGGPGDESLAEFVTRRLGREAYERLVQPLIGGIYTADPTRLSMQAALPQFVQMEQQHGGLLRAVWRSRQQRSAKAGAESGARYGLFVAPRDGMESLLRAIASRLPPGAIRFSTAVESLQQQDGGKWRVSLRDSAERLEFDGLIVAAPAPAAAELLREASTELASELRAIPYASAAIVALGYRREQVQHPLDGFGVVVPQAEKRNVLAVSLASIKFPGRAPPGEVLLRVFIGGACQPELVELPAAELEQLARKELEDLLGVTGSPRVVRVVRWIGAMPQYHVGHLDRVARIERAAASLPTLALAGNAYRGVGIPYCVHSGEQAAESLAAAIARRH
jgi:oxygen-dependent protoporphyrinogen oxidase